MELAGGGAVFHVKQAAVGTGVGRLDYSREVPK